MTTDTLLTIAIGMLFLNLLILSIRLNNHADRLDNLEGDGERLPDYEPVTIAMAKTCEWVMGFNDWWVTGCGKRHETIIGTDKAVAFTYCPSCGRKIVKADSK